MYAPLDPELQKLQDEDTIRLKHLERKYPKAKTDDFQKAA